MKQSRYTILSRGLKRTRGEMNRAEKKYAESLGLDSEVFRFWFEPFSLRLSNPSKGQGARYTPDFMVLMNDGTTYIDDVKPPGNFDDNASIVRIKTAAEMFPLWRFRVVKAKRVKDGGGFNVREV